MTQSPTPIQAVIDPNAASLLLSSMKLPAGLSAEEATMHRYAVLQLAATMGPRDLLEAALAVRAAGMHQALMDGLAHAVRPGLGEDLVLRHRGKSFTAARLMDKAMAWLEQRQLRAVRPVARLTEDVIAAAEGPVLAVAEAPVETAAAQVVPPGVAAAPGTEAEPERATRTEAPEVGPAEASPAGAVEATPNDAAEAVVAVEDDALAAEPVAATGWVAKRQQDLETKLARGEALTGAQREWLRRQAARAVEMREAA